MSFTPVRDDLLGLPFDGFDDPPGQTNQAAAHVQTNQAAAANVQIVQGAIDGPFPGSDVLADMKMVKFIYELLFGENYWLFAEIALEHGEEREMPSFDQKKKDTSQKRRNAMAAALKATGQTIRFDDNARLEADEKGRPVYKNPAGEVNPVPEFPKVTNRGLSGSDEDKIVFWMVYYGYGGKRSFDSEAKVLKDYFEYYYMKTAGTESLFRRMETEYKNLHLDNRLLFKFSGAPFAVWGEFEDYADLDPECRIYIDPLLENLVRHETEYPSFVDADNRAKAAESQSIAAAQEALNKKRIAENDPSPQAQRAAEEAEKTFESYRAVSDPLEAAAKAKLSELTSAEKAFDAAAFYSGGPFDRSGNGFKITEIENVMFDNFFSNDEPSNKDEKKRQQRELNIAYSLPFSRPLQSLFFVFKGRSAYTETRPSRSKKRTADQATAAKLFDFTAAGFA